MRKYGKYEKRPEAKNVLQQTYFTSLLCMVLCVSMFFGTTYAWFTSEITSKNNEIYIGTLDVGLYKKTAAEPQDLSIAGNMLFDKNIRWEPGYTAMETVIIRNEGDLAFQYDMTFTSNDKSTVDAALQKTVGDNFVVYVHPGDYAVDEEKPTSFADIVANAESDEPTWRAIRLGEKVATLSDIISHEIPVLSGSMTDVRADTVDPVAAEPGPNDSKSTEQTYIIALHMNEDANSEDIMGQKLHLNVKLMAYQKSYEKDSFDWNYDLQQIHANVIELGKTQVMVTQGGEPMTLDATYQFLPVESAQQAEQSPYKDYVADYVIWADRDIKAETIGLAGYYQFFCKNFNDNLWVPMSATGLIETKDVNEQTPIRLVQQLFRVTYQLLCQFGNDGIGFLCGIEDVADGDENMGTKIFVELRLYEVDASGNETGNFIVVGDRQEFVCG